MNTLVSHKSSIIKFTKSWHSNKKDISLLIIDVGASSGEFSKHILKFNANANVYMIEPNHEVNQKQLLAIMEEYK